MPSFEPAGATAWIGNELADVAAEVARMASACGVALLAPGVIERLLRDDRSVATTANPVAFGKLRSLLMMHYAIRQRAVDEIGEAEVRAIVADIIAKLKVRWGVVDP